jgi:hypothetical protein
VEIAEVATGELASLSSCRRRAHLKERWRRGEIATRWAARHDFTRYHPALLHEGNVKRSIDCDEESGALVLRPRIMNHLRGHVGVIARS